MYGILKYCPCIIKIEVWTTKKLITVGFVSDFIDFLKALTLGNEDLFGKHFYVDANKLQLTRDVSKAKQVNIPYYPINEYSEPSIGDFESILFNGDFKFDYRNIINDYYETTEVRIIALKNDTTLESIQDDLDRNYPIPRKAISKKVRQQVYDKYSGHCAYCGKKLDIKDMQVDHFVSHMNNKGIDDISNYMPSCKLCNKAKDSYTIEQFRSYIEQDAPRIHFKNNRKIYGEGAIADRIVTAYNLKQFGNKVAFYFEIVKPI
jgi:hypothetical protein